MEDENSRIDKSSKKISDGMGFGKIEKVCDDVTKPVKTWMVPSVTGSKTASVANKKRTVLPVQQEGIHGSLIPIQDKIDLTNAHEKNEKIPEETAVKIEKDNCDNDSSLVGIVSSNRYQVH